MLPFALSRSNFGGLSNPSSASSAFVCLCQGLSGVQGRRKGYFDPSFFTKEMPVPPDGVSYAHCQKRKEEEKKCWPRGAKLCTD